MKAFFQEKSTHEVELRLRELLTESEVEALNAQFVLRRGFPFVEIVRYAKEADIDLVVLGTHGRGAVAHMLLGSVAERVVRKVGCPVLSVKPHEHEFVLP